MAKTVSKQTVNGVDYEIMDVSARSGVSTLGTQVGNLGTQVGNLGTQVGGLETQVGGLGTQVGTLTERTNETFCGDYSDATEITSGQNFNDFVTPGNYVATTAAVVESCSNYPVAASGRLYVFSSVGTTAFIQIYITSVTSDIYARRVSTINPSSNTAWKRTTTGPEVDSLMGNAIRSQGLAASDADVDNFPNGSIIGVANSDINTVAHFPKDYQSGGAVITTGYMTTGSAVGRLQICYFFRNDCYAWRRNIDSQFTDWHYEGIVTLTRTVGPTGRSFTNPANAIKYYTDEQYMGLWNEHYRFELIIDPGTYNMNAISTWYEEDPVRFVHGLYIPPFWTIRGSGKHNTILTFLPSYTDTSDERLASVSPFNMPYESTLKDLSLIVKNCRYCVHSETNFPGFDDGTVPISSSRVRNCQITCENVYFEHRGIESQYTPRYAAPACWGNGSYDNSNETFIDCDFVSAQYCSWLSHNRVGLTLPSTFIFENCTFINKNEIPFSAVGNYASIMFISWADDDIKMPVKMKNCYANRFVLLSVRSGEPASDNPKNNYFLYADNGIMVTEQITNNAHRTDNYRTGNCNALYANTDLSVAYRPVSFNDDGGAHAYSDDDPYHGIVLHTATAGDEITVQIKGKIELARCGISGFSAGTLLGYSNSTWVEDSTHPIIKVLTANIGEIV